MVEIWFNKVKRGVAGNGFKPFRWMLVFPPGIWIIITAVALVGGRLFWVNASRPAHIEEITAALGTAGQFYGVPQMNHRGSQFTYVATDDHGYSLFLRDASTGQKQVMLRQSGLGDWGDSLDMCPGPWSPDDSSFMYSARGKWFLCPVDTNRTTVRLDIGGNIPVANIIWLNPRQFAWLDGQTISYAQQAADGQWESHPLPHRGRMLCLTAIDEHTIAWLEEDFICRLNLSDYLAGTSDPFAPPGEEAYAAPLTNNLMLWLDASTLLQSNQTPVKSLADLSRYNNSASLNLNPPRFNTTNSPLALNRRGTIHFESGTNIANATGLKTVKRLGLTGSQPRSVFAVMRRDTGRAKMLINIGNTLTNGTYFGICDQSDFLYLPAGSFPGRNDGRIGSLPASWHILETIYDGTNANSYANGGFLGQVTLPFKTSDTAVEIGLRTGNYPGRTNTAASDGDFAELLVYDRALSAAEQLEVEDYLGVKWFGNRRPVSPKNGFVWLNPQMKGLTGFKYSRELGRFLINRTENGQDSLWRLDTKTETSAIPSQVAQDRVLQEAQWIGTGEFDCIGREPGHQGLLLTDSSGKHPSQSFGQENIPWFQVTPNERKMLFIGNVSNCPSVGIWQYDFGSRQLQAVAPWSEHPSLYAQQLKPFQGDIRLPSGRSVHCTVFLPANFDRRKKYPLLLGNTVVDVEVMGAPILKAAVRAAHGRLWAQCLATGGAFVVIINRGSWNVDIDQWEENIRGVHQSLLRDPCIDANQVFLFAASAETRYLNDCLAKSPGLWKGAIYLSPVMLPDFAKVPVFQSRPKILISIGSIENREVEIRRNATNNLSYGVIEELIVHPGEAHRVYGNIAQFERTRAMMRFIFEE